MDEPISALPHDLATGESGAPDRSTAAGPPSAEDGHISSMLPSPAGEGAPSASETPPDTHLAKRTPMKAPRAAWVDAAGLAEGGLLADVGIILDLATIYLPLASPILAPAVPTPFAILMLRRGPRATLLASAVSAFLVTILAGPHFGWRMGLEAIVGLLLGWAMRHRLRWVSVLSLATVLVSTVTFAAALGVLILTGLPLHDLLQELRNGLMTLAAAAAWTAGVLGQRSAWLQIRPSLAALGTLMLRYWPLLFYGYVAFFTLPMAALYYGIANVTARVLGHPVLPFPSRGLLNTARVLGMVVLAPVLLPLALWTRVRRAGRRGNRRAAPATEGARDA